jgi:NAD(P)-dependent dehydrogenase (short-subunit alcohol dehydrogenase family)
MAGARGAGVRLDGKIAVVTGGGSGLGRGIALAFAREGARVIAVGRRPPPLQETVAAICQAGGEAEAFSADVTNDAAAARMAGFASERFGGCHILVAAAGTRGAVGKVTDLDMAGWREALDVNVTGPLICARHLIPLMRRSGSGSIINIGSMRLTRVKGGGAAYIASKGALLFLTKVMALDHASEGIRVNMVSPGLVLTDFTRYVIEGYDDPEQGKRHWGGQYPLGRIGTEEDIAQACIYLASEASAWVTGQVLNVDGGMSVL